MPFFRRAITCNFFSPDSQVFRGFEGRTAHTADHCGAVAADEGIVDLAGAIGTIQRFRRRGRWLVRVGHCLKHNAGKHSAISSQQSALSLFLKSRTAARDPCGNDKAGEDIFRTQQSD